MKQSHAWRTSVILVCVSNLLALNQMMLGDELLVNSNDASKSVIQKAVRPSKPTASNAAAPVVVVPEFEYLMVDGNAKILGNLAVCGKIDRVDDCLRALQSCCEMQQPIISNSCCDILQSQLSLIQLSLATLTDTTETVLSFVENIDACCNTANSKIDQVQITADSILDIISKIQITIAASGLEGIFTELSLIEECCLSANSKIDNVQNTSNTTLSFVENIDACCNTANSKLDEIITIDQSILDIVSNLQVNVNLSGLEGSLLNCP